jgi:hypothetical protein
MSDYIIMQKLEELENNFEDKLDAIMDKLGIKDNNISEDDEVDNNIDFNSSKEKF